MTLTLPPKIALAAHERLRRAVLHALGPDRRPLLIGIDGRDGAGKTHLANWLAWQIGAPAVHLDLYLVRTEAEHVPLSWRTDDLAATLAARLDHERRPVVLEGVLLLDAMNVIGRSVDFLVYARRPRSTECVPFREVADYVRRTPRLRRPDCTVLGFEDVRVPLHFGEGV